MFGIASYYAYGPSWFPLLLKVKGLDRTNPPSPDIVQMQMLYIQLSGVEGQGILTKDVHYGVLRGFGMESNHAECHISVICLSLKVKLGSF